MNGSNVFAGSVGTANARGKASVNGAGEGVYAFRLAGNSLEPLGVARAENAGIIGASPDGRFIYAANETRDFAGGLAGSGGGVTAFRVLEDGKLERNNDSISYGSRPSNVAVSADGRFLLVSNHGSHSAVVCRYTSDAAGGWKLERGFDDSSIACFALREDGGIGKLIDLKVFDGSGYWDQGAGQSTSHLHCVRITSTGLVLACNRGADTIEVMRLGPDGHLTLLNRHRAQRGYAPRHLAVDETHSMIYVCNENYPAVSAYRFDDASGELTELQTIATLPDDHMATHPLPHFERAHHEPDERNTTSFADPETAGPADVHLSHDGRFLYVTNRFLRPGASNSGSIASFRIDDSGTLQQTGVWELPGQDPRGFLTSPVDHRLVVGLLDRNIALILEADSRTGAVVRELSRVDTPSPASVVWM